MCLVCTKLLCLMGCYQKSGLVVVNLCELVAAIAEEMQHEMFWPEIWGFSSGTEWPNAQNCWESGKNKLSSSLLGMVQQTNFA